MRHAKLLYKLLLSSLLAMQICLITKGQNRLYSQPDIRSDIHLDKGWETKLINLSDDLSDDLSDHQSDHQPASFEKWSPVTIPHNWDKYEGYRRLLHGNKHGSALYRKSFFLQKKINKRYFLFFEGVGSYATVWLNGKQVGAHAGGRTSFTIDITDYILWNQQNDLKVRADHPANSKDLPWVCGGCSDERGFSEGSQPMGIFRPVHLIITDEIRIEPFGVHVWNNQNVSKDSAKLNIATTIKNYGSLLQHIRLQNQLINKDGKIVASIAVQKTLSPGDSITVMQMMPRITNVHLWSIEDPYLYKLVTSVVSNNQITDQLITPYGIRSIFFDRGKSNRFFLNGKPVFINGIAEYEHLLGNSHAFSHEQIASRAKLIHQMGFNGFRDAHQPHHLNYQAYWDSLGVLWWTQFSAHVWYDTKLFRDNFKSLLREWVIERRNSPSVILWGLQNESKIPADFARECTELIRSLDPTASEQRLVTTCNGGEGTDWDVPQNWTGTYGGDPYTYDQDLKKQVLIGEYGAWRMLDLHTEGNFKQNGVWSEDRMTQLLEMKIRLAEKVKDSAAGQFAWLLTSHDNPGRVQGGEGYRSLDRIGPVNYKGLFTPWEEPTDAYYMYKSNYASNRQHPMVYIVSHTWPDRWTKPGIKDSIIVYSNCDEVELFNDAGKISLGKQKRQVVGTHFQWHRVNILYNVLYAIGYVNGKAVAKDFIELNYLPPAPNQYLLHKNQVNLTKPKGHYHYLYRVNCGGPALTDQNGNRWMADKAFATDSSVKFDNKNWGSVSWTNHFQGLPAFLASQRNTSAIIHGTKDQALFQDFRYGREQLKYFFPVADGEYLVELYFVEPWLGIGSKDDCSGMRLFDVAINDRIVIHDLDIWKAVGTNHALKKTLKVLVKGGKLVIGFPQVSAGQALISAIAIASLNPSAQAAASLPPLIQYVDAKTKNQHLACPVKTWLNTGCKPFVKSAEQITSLPSELYGAEWIQLHPELDQIVFSVNRHSDVYIAVSKNGPVPVWLSLFENTHTFIETTSQNSGPLEVYKIRLQKNEQLQLDAIQFGFLHLIAMHPATSMQPAFDLKKAISYKAAVIQPLFAAEQSVVHHKEAVVFKSDSASAQWTISTGVADIYSLTIAYANTSLQARKGRLQLLSADGMLLKEEPIQFTPSKPGKWNYIVTNTGTMVNAGKYFVRIFSTDANGIYLSSLEVQ